jgi:hypothetical protein
MLGTGDEGTCRQEELILQQLRSEHVRSRYNYSASSPET